MANHEWNAMPGATVPAGRIDAAAAAPGIASSLVQAREPWQGGGCGASGAFGGGALLALPALLVAVLVRRVARRGARRPDAAR